MRLSAVAIMANNVGCVCQYPSGQPAAPAAIDETGSSTAGMATIMLQQQEETARQTSHRPAQ
jgi:hypothetical protein